MIMIIINNYDNGDDANDNADDWCIKQQAITWSNVEYINKAILCLWVTMS